MRPVHFMTRWDFRNYSERCVSPYNTIKSNAADNVILSAEMRLGMNSKVTHKNNNVVLIGDSNTGKTLSYVAPNLSLFNTNYVIADADRKLYKKYADDLLYAGYEVKVFDPYRADLSGHYNPFRYAQDDKGIDLMVEAILGQSYCGDVRRSKAEHALLSSLLLHVMKSEPYGTRTLHRVMELLSLDMVRLDGVFEKYFASDSEDSSVVWYRKYLDCPRELRKEVHVGVASAVKALLKGSVGDLLSNDTIDLTGISYSKCALFIVTDTLDTSFRPLTSLMCAQAMTELFNERAEYWRIDSARDLPVHFILDDFAIIGKIPYLADNIVRMQKYNVFCSIVIPSVREMQRIYRDDFEAIAGNCDTVLYYDSSDRETNSWVSLQCGIDSAYLERLPDRQCYVFVAGESPYMGAKYGV